MTKKIVIIIVLIVLLGGFAFFVDKRNTENLNRQNLEQTEEESEFTVPLAVKYQYRDGVHTFVGDIELPSNCYNYNAVIEDGEDDSTKNLAIDYERNKDVEVCAQVITTANYRISYEGPEDLKFKAFVNGEARRLNIFEIPEGENIDEFELFIKG